MKYSEAREKIKSGDLLAFSHDGWKTLKDFKTQMVRVFTRSTYSHVGIAVELSGRLFCLEAVIPEVRLYPLSKLGSFYYIPMDIEWSDSLAEKAFSHIGDKYSQLSAMKAFFKDLGQGKTSECAALVDTVYGYAGVDVGTKQIPDDIILQTQLLGKPLWYIQN